LGLVETRHALSNDEKVKNGLHHEEHREGQKKSGVARREVKKIKGEGQ
jgi:hypothetical protein